MTARQAKKLIGIHDQLVALKNELGEAENLADYQDCVFACERLRFPVKRALEILDGGKT